MGTKKHYINPKETGITCFVTATCLDFAHLFQRDQIKTQMCLSILDDCTRHQAKLKGFVVMSHHIHLLVRPNQEETISQLMQPLKENAVALIKPRLNEFELSQLQMQDGLSRRTFWKRSFRGNPIHTEPVFLQKLHYIQANPIRAGKCELPEDYVWSSAHLRMSGWFDEENALDLKLAKDFYLKLVNQ